MNAHKAMVTDIEMAMNDVLANFGLLEDVSAGTVHALATAVLTAALAQAETQPVDMGDVLREQLDRPRFKPASPVPAKREAGDPVLLRNLRDTFDAMCAMRDSINEYIPMPSLESDLLQGPETGVFCATVAEAVISAFQALSTSSTPTDGEDTCDD